MTQPTPDDRRAALRARIASVPVSTAIGSRRLRRIRVSALYGGFALAGAAFVLRPAGLAPLAVAALFIAGIAACGYGFATLLRRTTINAPQIGSDALDERQRARRDDAIRVGFTATSILAALGAAYATLVWTFAPALWPTLVYVLWGGFVVATTLPTALLAWSEPDPEPDEA